MLPHSHEKVMGQKTCPPRSWGRLSGVTVLRLSSDLSTHSQCSGAETGGLLSLPGSSFSERPCLKGDGE